MSFLLDRLHLRFIGESVERQFLAETIGESLSFIRVYLLAAAFLYAAFGALDVITDDPALPALLMIRMVACTVLLGTFALSFHRDFPLKSQMVLLFAAVAPGLGVVGMTAIMRPPFNSLYYAGLIMVVMYGSCLVRLRFFYAAIATLTMFLAYQLSALYVNPIAFKFYVSNNFFLTMASAVGLFSGYLQELYIRKSWVGQKTIEAKNEQTEILLVEAQKASKSKSDFLANMSHELRTPLNAIIGFSDIISKEILGPLGNAKYAEYSNDIKSSGAHLLSIINEILDLAKAESGKLRLNEEPVDLMECVTEAIRICDPAAEKGSVMLELSPCAIAPIVLADRRLLLQIILNLTSNAVKFTHPGGRVDILLRIDADGASVAVRDTGIGIPPGNLERVMRPFEQVETSYSRTHGGTGLGLPYSLKLAELHDGTIRLQSELYQGTTATLWLPLTRLYEARPVLRAAG